MGEEKMSQVIDRIPHTCGTKRGLIVYADEEGNTDGYCFSCDTYVPHPYGEPKKVEDLPPREEKTEAEIAAMLAEVQSLPTVDVKERKLRATSLEAMGVKIGLSERDGKTPREMYFPLTKNGKVTGYQVKTVGLGEHNKVYAIGDCKDVDLFNWENAKKSGARRLIVTEGMADAVAVDAIFRLYGKEEWFPAIVSIPYGAGRAHTCLQKHAKDINRMFKDVLLCFDNDKPGQDAVAKSILVLPHAKSVTLPEKDANECIIKGRAKAAYNAMAFQAEQPKNTRLVTAASIHLAARQPPKWGELSWPWEKMNDDQRGIRLGDTIYIGAGTKMGKTTIKNALGAHFIQNDGVKVFMAAPEEPNEMTYKLMANQLTGKIFHDPKVEFDYDAFDEAGRILKDKLYMLNVYQHLGWNTLKEDIQQTVAEGCKVVVVDPITNLSNGVNAGEANTLLQEFAQDLSAMARDLQFTAFLFCHLKAADGHLSEDKRQSFYNKGQFFDLGNCSHEMGGSVYSSQFAGSRAMQRSCNLMLGVLGNKDPDLPEETRNIRQVRVLEDRAWGSSEAYNLFWNRNTGRFIEV
jgi:twinkle protein